MFERFAQNYFLFFFSIIPISIIVGPSISLVNILIIDFSFLLLILYKKNFSFIKKDAFKYLFLLYIYLIFNSLISLESEIGLNRNLGFIRIIILFIAINYFFYNREFNPYFFGTYIFIKGVPIYLC